MHFITLCMHTIKNKNLFFFLKGTEKEQRDTLGMRSVKTIGQETLSVLNSECHGRAPVSS